jgi:nucleotide-binding universal stress UspA family protein
VFDTMVIPLDGSPFAANALPTGAALARDVGARLRVVGIARSDAELALTWDHVHADAERAGLDNEDVDVFVDPDPVGVLLGIAGKTGNVLCVASHARPAPVAELTHAVGSQLLERAVHPLVVVGSHPSTAALGTDVVVALDGTDNAEPLLAVAASWAVQLHGRLRIVTVYEPVPSDLRRPEYFDRRHGPTGDPDAYLAAMRDRVSDVGLDGVDTVAVADPIDAGAGLEQHLADHPARLLVVGGGHRHRPHLGAGVAHHLLTAASLPLLIVNRNE